MAVTITNVAAPMIEFYQTAAADVRVRVYDTQSGFIAQADIAAADWTKINTAMASDDPTSTYQVAMKSGGSVTKPDYAS